MKYLLDSHVLIWALFSDEKLARKAFDIINSRDNEIYYSAASIWEIGMKHAKAPEKMPVSGKVLMECSEQAGMLSLPIIQEHAAAVNELRRKDGEPPHNDPFDKMLIAQAKCENMILLTHDRLLSGYGEDCVMEI